MARDNVNLAIAVAMIVVGVLLILGGFALQALLPVAGIVLLVVGILILVKALPGGTLLGVVALVVGLLLMTGFLNLPDAVRSITDPLMRIINVVVGVLLIVFGALRLKG